MPLGLGPFLDWIVTFLLLILAALGGVHLYKKYAKPPQPAQAQAAPQHSAAPARTASSAEQILVERYARGEIDRTQYLDMLEDLKTHPSGVFPEGTGTLSDEEIVRQRYARGEIDRDQFHQMMIDLRYNRQ